MMFIKERVPNIDHRENITKYHVQSNKSLKDTSFWKDLSS
jgi:hypothetical protein